MPPRHLFRKTLMAGAATTTAVFASDDYLFYGNAKRCMRAAGVGIFLIYQYKVNWTVENASEIHSLVASRITDMLNTNGGMYVKFGQTLTTMGHVLPPEYMEKLRVLFSDSRTYPGEEMIKVIEAELGKPISELFKSFNEDPVASASIAQVHKATLHDGTEVAVKVQKPLISYQHKIDFFMLHVLLFCIEKSFGIPCLWSYDFAVERYASELDFNEESRNSQKASTLLKQFSSRIHVPPVRICTRRVLVSEWVADAVTIDNIDGLKKMNVNQKDIMELAVGMYAYQIFESGHVHCDPHPGNLLVRNVNNQPQLVLLDHGLYVCMTDELRRDYATFWSSMLLANQSELRKICNKWGITDPDFFASVTQQRPFKGSRGAGQMMSQKMKPPTSAELAKMHMKVKDKLTTILAETASFPPELMFVGRALNYLRSHNWCHGSVINRVRILGTRAARGLSCSEYVKFQSTFTVLRFLEFIKTNFSALWSSVIYLIPSGKVSNYLLAFSTMLDSSPMTMSEV